VNDELGSLQDALAAALDWIKPGGRLAVITFHSLEDRLVKNFLRQRSERWLNRPEWPEPRANPEFCLELCPRKGIKPGDEEVARNPRARSALLRVAQVEGSGLVA
jgi:16S rRNA (cytosine1402-N4)-methyltransferase